MEQANSLLERLRPALENFRRLAARALWFALAVFFLVESWLWDNVKEWLRALERRLGLERFESWLTALVARLSPPMTLGLFLIPIVALFPLKIAALAIFAQGHVVAGVALILFAKTFGLGVEAFLFDICREKLLEMQWFGRLYSVVLDVRAWATLLVRPFKARLAELALRVRGTATDAAKALFGDQKGEWGRRIARLRELARPKRST